tara:strand:+ start:7262 stop:8560 length:1299 start_codon:yes stop_codon:yes gene_type:complete
MGQLKNNRVECAFKDAVFKISTTKQKLKQKEYLQRGEIPVIDQGKDFIGGFTDDQHRILDCKLPVIIFGDHTKNVKLIDFSFAPGADGTKVLQPKKYIIPKFLFYITEVLVFKIKDNGYARHYQHIEKENFTLVSIPEQKAIVQKIEELFSSLDSGIAGLKRAQELLKIYRQAVLKKAFDGELTNKWREKKSIVRENWKKNKLGEVLKTIDGDRGKNYPKKNEFVSEGYCLFLSTKNVRQGEFVFDENQFISEEKDNLLGGGKLKRNDVVLTTRGTLGNVAIYDSKIQFKNIRINSGMLILRVNNFKELSQSFLMRFINSSLFFKQLKAKQSGTAQPQIPANVLREIEIEIPSEIEEQHQIVKEIESRLSVCDAVEESIKESLEKAEALRQSILKRAFAGQLLSEEELADCKSQPDYEPASVLLEKLKAEKK